MALVLSSPLEHPVNPARLLTPFMVFTLLLLLSACSSVHTSLPTPTSLAGTAQDIESGDVITWGDPWGDGASSAQHNVPDLPYGFSYKAISTTAGQATPSSPGGHTLGLWSNGEVVQWGDDNREAVPEPPLGLVYTAISAGENQNIGLWSNGQPIVWGDDTFDQKKVPRPPQGEIYTAIAAGGFHLVGLWSNGGAVSWGATYLGNDQSAIKPGPFQAVAAGFDYSLALAKDGTITAWGENTYGQLNVPELPEGMHYTAIYASASAQYSAALRSDGQLVVWGRKNQFDAFPTNIPDLPVGQIFTEAALGPDHAYARTSSGTWLGWGVRDIVDNMPELPTGLVYTSVAAGGYIDSAVVGKQLSTPAPGGEDLHAADFHTAPKNRILWHVTNGRGLSYLGSGGANPGKVRFYGTRFVKGKLLGGNQARVVTMNGTKVLAITKPGTNRPNPGGGQLEIRPSAAFGASGGSRNGRVTLKGLTVHGVSTRGAYLVLRGGRDLIRRVPLALSPTQTLELNEPGVSYIQVNVKNAFSIDNVVFDAAAGQ
jgi:hypothetical protein